MIRSTLRRYRKWLTIGLAREEQLDRLYDQLAGLTQISSAIEGSPVLKPLRQWALSPDAMALILADLQEYREPVVVEFGSGQSTVILAAALRHRGGKLVTVDHDLCYAQAVKRQVGACGLEEHVQFVNAPIALIDMDLSIRSYDLSAMPRLEADCVLVDGPPYTNGQMTRLIPLRWAASHLKRGGLIFLDDTNRAAEQACLNQVQKEFPLLSLEHLRAEKGLVRFFHRSSSGSIFVDSGNAASAR